MKCWRCKKTIKASSEACGLADLIVCNCQIEVKNREGLLKNSELNPGLYFFDLDKLFQAKKLPPRKNQTAKLNYLNPNFI